MDSKVILMAFGVVLLLAAIFFFFKSFASHEQRMLQEQQQRLEIERKQAEAERAEAHRPLTPEELAQKRRLEEVRLAAEKTRQAAMQAARELADKKRAENQIDGQKRSAGAAKQSAEELRLAEEVRLKQAEEAKKKAEADRIKAEEDAKVRQAQDRKQQAAAALNEMRNWMETVLQQAPTAYPVKAQPPMASGTGAARVYIFTPSGTGAVVAPATYNAPDEIPGFAAWEDDMLVAFCKKAMADDASRQDPEVTTPDLFAKIALIEDADALKETHKSLATQSFKAQDADANVRKNQAAGRTLASMALRQIEKLDRQKAELDRQATAPTAVTPATNSRAIGTTGPTSSQMLEGIRAEKQKNIEKLRSQIISYWKAMNGSRGTAAAVKLLNEAKRLVGVRLGELGVADAAPATAGTTAPKEGAAYKIYVMNDGTQIKAYTVVKMGDQLAIKDETGEVKTVDAADVKEIKKP